LRRFVDILLITVLIALTIIAGNLFIKVNRELNEQLKVNNIAAEVNIAIEDANLTEESTLDAYSDKAEEILSPDSGQAYSDETGISDKHMDNMNEIYEEPQRRKDRFKSNIQKVQEIQGVITSSMLSSDSKADNRGRIDRKQQFKSKTVDLSTYKDLPAELLDWWDSVDKLFEKSISAVVIDLETGKRFEVVRTYGSNHADVETLTAEDTAVMKEIWGGEWNWERRAVIVIVNGKKIAASATGMPHAGLDNLLEGENVDNRSGDFGTGINLDKIKGNNMDGHFDIHFLNSSTHGTDRIDENHQQMVQKAFEANR
jgi:hypothetical protein